MWLVDVPARVVGEPLLDLPLLPSSEDRTAMSHHKPKRSMLRQQIRDEAARRHEAEQERDRADQRAAQTLTEADAAIAQHTQLTDEADRARNERDTERARVAELEAALRTIRRIRPSVNGRGTERAQQIASNVLGETR